VRRKLSAAVIAAAVAAIGAVPVIGLAQLATEATPQQATQPANADVPVKKVVLFSSGVGYFEHYGTVNGDGTAELSFKTAQINDVLKSLLLEDLDKGQVSAVTYPSTDPLDKTLKSFEVDVSGNPSLPDLLTQLRGAKVSVSTQGDKFDGTILGVDKKQRQVDAKDGGKTIEVDFLNLVSGGTIRSVNLDDVRELKLDSPKLQDELDRALAALAASRDQDKKPVTIAFRGQGERRVRIGYVVETPVWKTSYRLVLSGAAATQPADAHAEDTKYQAGDVGAQIQGWAIVENQSDTDWNNVQLSLVSGRPISFIEDLYQPLYIPRPVVVPELFASLMPQTYEAGLRSEDSRRAGGGGGGGFGVAGAAPAAPPAAMARQSDRLQEALNEPMNPVASVASAASGAKLGDLFQYTIREPVSLPRHKSAMIPIVTDPIEVERVSIYNAAVMPRNPLNGARLKNTTGKHLLSGPITVLEGGTYAGDAQIDNVPPGQERFISYGIDLQVLVDPKDAKQEEELLTGKISKGVLELSNKVVATQTYVAENKSDRDKTLVVEHPVRQGWELVDSPKPMEKTDQVYRFKESLPAGKSVPLTVKEQVVNGQQIEILPADIDGLVALSRNGKLPQNVRDALAKAASMKSAVTDTQRQIDEDQKKIDAIVKDQKRINETLRTINQSSKLYDRLMKELDDQETQLKDLRGQIDDLTNKHNGQQKELENYIAGLNVA